MEIKIFTDDGLALLKSSVKKNARRYADNRRQYFDRLTEDRGFAKLTIYKVADFNVMTDGPAGSIDALNVRIVHEALKTLPRQLLAKEALWSELSHNEFWDYVQLRRAKKLKSGDLDKIAQSYFFTTGFKRSLFVHCLAKLYWVGELIYDKDSNDPYHHLRLFDQGFNGKAVLFSSSSFTSNTDVALGILDAISLKNDGAGPVKRKYFVEATKHLNRLGGVTLLDAIPREEVAQIVFSHFERIGL